MALSLNDFGKAVVAAGLFPADELKALLAASAADARPKNAAALAKLLVEQGHLTQYQADELLAGRGPDLVLGEYVIQDKIGAGGMGQVLKAVHRKMGRTVALKLMSTSAMKDEAAIKRFHREVKAAARLEHENIVTAHTAGEARGMHYLVMQYVEGVDLSGRVKKDGPLSIDLAMNCICQAARGLAYAHSEGIIHRDIKPANLLLDKKGVVKILDMGLARIDGGDAHDGLTGTEQVLGTVDYMSPEQAVSTRDCDARADIYSLGCTLWYLLTGTKVYSGDSPIQRLMQHREAPLPSLLKVRDEIPWALEKLFHKMVAKQPDDRCQAMDEVVQEIEHIRSVSESGRTSAVDEDTNLGQFFKTLGGTGATRPSALAKPTEQKSSTVDADTQDHSDSRKTIPTTASRVPPWKNAKVLTASGTAFVLILAGIVTILRNNKGEEVGRVQVPDNTSVIIQKDGKEVVTIPASSVSSGQASVGLSPPLAKAPFTSRQARTAQDNWGKYFATPVTSTTAVGIKMALIPPGEFLMGSTSQEVDELVQGTTNASHIKIFKSETPQHLVRISRPFRLGIHEVTVSQFRKFVDATGYKTEAERDGKGGVSYSKNLLSPEVNWRRDTYVFADDDPVGNVTWNDAVEFCNYLSNQDKLPPYYEKQGATGWMVKGGDGYRLPTEAEWEFGCRAGTVTAFFGDNMLTSKFGRLGPSRSDPVGATTANAFGLHDMFANVQEWCGDYWMEDYYAHSPGDDPPGPALGTVRVVRGGSFAFDTQTLARSASRTYTSASTRTYGIGFRVARSLSLPTASPSMALQTKTPREGSVARNAASPLDALAHEQTSAEEWTAAGMGESAKASAELVAVLGDSRFMHWSAINGLAYSPDGKWLASASSDHTIKVWNPANGRERWVINAPPGVYAIAYSPDGKTIASGHTDGKVRLWDVSTSQAPTKEKMSLVHSDRENVNAVTYSPDGKTLASAGVDKLVKLWDPASGKAKGTLTGHTSVVRTLAFDHDGQRFASAGDDHLIKLWDLAGNKEETSLDAVEPVRSIAFHPDGQTLASGGISPQNKDSLLKIWDLVTRKEKATVKLASHSYALAYSPDGKLLVTSDSYRLRLLDPVNGRELAVGGNRSTIQAVAFSPDGKQLAAADTANMIKTWDVSTGKLTPLPTYGDSRPRSVARSPDGRTLAAAYLENKVKLWDASTGKLTNSLSGLTHFGQEAEFSPDGRLLAAGCTDGHVHVWDVATAKETSVLKGHAAPTESVAFSPDGHTIASGSYDHTARLWEVTTGGDRAILKDFSGAVRCVRFSPDGKLLVTGGDDTTVRLWDASTGSLVKKLVQGRAVPAVAFSPDSRTLVAGSHSAIALWDIVSGRAAATSQWLDGSGWVTSVAYSPDGRTIAASSDEGQVRLWDAASAELLKTIRLGPSSGIVHHVSFDATGRYLLTANANGTIYVLRLVPPPASDPDRRAAEWALSKGGKVTVQAPDAQGKMVGRSVSAVADLPAGEICVTAVTFPVDAKDVGGTLQKFAGLTRLTDLSLYGAVPVGDADAPLLAEFKNLWRLAIVSKGLTHVGLDVLDQLPKLTSLRIGGVRFDDKELPHLLALVHLQYLQLQGADTIDEAGYRQLLALPELNNLRVGNRLLTDRVIADLAKNPHITAVGLDSSSITSEGFRALSKLTWLQALAIAGTACTDVDLEHIVRLENLNSSLYLTNTPITDAGAAHLPALKKVTHLYLSGTRLTDAGLEHLAGMKSLVYLELRATKVTAAGITKLQKAVPKCKIDWDGASPAKNLKSEISTPQTPVPSSSPAKTDAPDRAVAEWILSSGGKVTVVAGGKKFDVTSNNNLPAGPLELYSIEARTPGVTNADLERLSGLVKLQSLTLVDSTVTAEGISRLPNLPSLTSLQFGNDAHKQPLDAAGLAALARLSNLTKLRTIGKVITTDQLAVLLPQLPKLTDLLLYSVGADDAMLAKIAEFKQIKVLNIQQSDTYSDAGLVHLSQLPNLQSLNIDSNSKLTDKAIESLGKLTKLKTLVITRTFLSISAIDRLRKALPECEVFWPDQNVAQGTIAGGGYATIVTIGGKRIENVKDVTQLPAETYAVEAILVAKGTPVEAYVYTGLVKLSTLTLARTQADDYAIRYLTGASIPSLVTLDLSGTQITDASITRLASLSKLVNVNLRSTKVTAAGVAKLQTALPKCKIEWDETK